MGFNIYMRSFTQAEKARAHLSKNRIRSIVKRGSGNGGCGFTLVVTDNSANRDRVCDLLRDIGISCDIS